jgi:hypothetical protein
VYKYPAWGTAGMDRECCYGCPKGNPIGGFLDVDSKKENEQLMSIETTSPNR